MTVGMTVWMRYRRHSWAMCAEMGAMLPTMLAVMLFRRSEYSQPVHS